MEAFNLSKINTYSIEELTEFILNGSTTKKYLYEKGLYKPKRPLLEKALETQDNEDWTRAKEETTIEAVKQYLDRYDKSAPYYRGRHVKEAAKLMTEITDGRYGRMYATHTKVQNIGFVNDISTEQMKGSEIESTTDTSTPIPIIKRKWFKITAGTVSLCIIALIAVVIYKAITKPSDPQPLSSEEIARIIQQKQDSLKMELFDGFHLSPAQTTKDAQRPNKIDEKEPIGPTSRQEVVAAYVASLNGKYNVVNKDGNILKLPEAEEGIDSLCLNNAPFIEYIDNNGLRRVVALFDDDVYYYLGECGEHVGFRQFILCNKNGKSGVVDVNGDVWQKFLYDKITLASGGYYVKNGSASQFYNFVGNAVDEKSPSTSSSNDNELSVVYSWSSPTHKDAFKDKSGNIVASFEDISSTNLKGFYRVKVANGKQGIYDTERRKMAIPAVYKEINTWAQNGNFIVKDSKDRYGIYNANTRQIVVPVQFEDISFTGSDVDLYPAKSNGKWGYVQPGGIAKIDFIFEDAASFNPKTSLAAAKKNGKWGYIDLSGKYKIEPTFYSANTMTPDGALVMKSSGEYGFINKYGTPITSWYPYMGSKFVLDRIFVRNEEKLGGFINRQNQLVIPYMFDSKYNPVFNGDTHLAIVSYKGIEWYINTNGAFCYPASSELKPSDQNIQQQISAAKKKAEEETAKKEEKLRKNNGTKKL